MSPYRTAPPAPQKAPRASWWRRLWRIGLSKRIDLRRRRHALAKMFPGLSWHARGFLARGEQAMGVAPGSTLSDLATTVPLPGGGTMTHFTALRRGRDNVKGRAA